MLTGPQWQTSWGLTGPEAEGCHWITRDEQHTQDFGGPVSWRAWWDRSSVIELRISWLAWNLLRTSRPGLTVGFLRILCDGPCTAQTFHTQGCEQMFRVGCLIEPESLSHHNECTFWMVHYIYISFWGQAAVLPRRGHLLHDLIKVFLLKCVLTPFFVRVDFGAHDGCGAASPGRDTNTGHPRCVDVEVSHWAQYRHKLERHGENLASHVPQRTQGGAWRTSPFCPRTPFWTSRIPESAWRRSFLRFSTCTPCTWCTMPAETYSNDFWGFLELISRVEFEFCRCVKIFEGFEFLVRSCECAVACLCPRISISKVVASAIHDNINK